MLNHKKGFTLTGVILIGMVVALAAVAGMDFYVSLLSRHQDVEINFAAVNLATAQLEDLLAMDYSADPQLVTGNNKRHTVIMPVTGYALDYNVDPPQADPVYGMLYKQITVNVTDPRTRHISLTAFKVSP